MTKRTLRTEPLTPEAFAPYGSLVMAERGDVVGKPANLGTAKRYNWLAPIEDLRPGASRPNLCLFRCAPRTTWPMVVEIMERHAFSTQVIVPMNAERYVVLVAEPGPDTPDLGTLRAFLATSRQGIAYLPGTWHHPIIALGAESDFASVVYEDEGEGDGQVVTLPTNERPTVELAV